jgi:hypothetical protein
MLSRVLGESLPDDYPYSIEGEDASVKATDFDDRVDVLPVSDPNVFSQAQRIALAQTKLELATAAPELHNMNEVYRDMYEALGVRDADRIMKRSPVDEPEPKDPAQENIDLLDMMQLHAFDGQDHEAHIMAHLVFATSPLVSGNPMFAASIQKHIMEHVQIGAREQAVVAFIQQAQVQQGQPLNEEQMLQVEALVAQNVAQGLQQVQQLSRKLAGSDQPDPLISLKEKELQIKAQSEQSDAQIDQAKLKLDEQNQKMRSEQFDQRLASQEKQTGARIQSAMEREILKQRQ